MRPRTRSKLEIIDVDQLRQIPAPITTDTYIGVEHANIYDRIRHCAKEIGLDHYRDRIEITNGGLRAFMNIQFIAGNAGTQLPIKDSLL